VAIKADFIISVWQQTVLWLSLYRWWLVFNVKSLVRCRLGHLRGTLRAL